MTMLTLNQASTAALARIGGLRAPRRPAASGGLHRTGAPVLRGSIEAGTFEDSFFAVPPKGEPDRMLRAARAALDAGRRLKRTARVENRPLSASERPIAALTAGAVRVYEALATLARLNRGQVYPSYDWLADATALGRATVARSLHLLEAAGLLIRQRRFARVAGEGPGPRYKQTSNAYRLALPARLLALLPRWLRPAPVPYDALDHAAAQAEAVETMRAGLSCRELAQATVGGALGRVLARLGAALDTQQRESQDHPQPLIKSYEKDFESVGLVGQQHRPDGQHR